MSSNSAEYSRAHYLRNKEKRLRQIKASQDRRWQRSREAAWDYLLAHPCVDCGETDPVVLEFDHISGEKFMAVSAMMRSYGWAKIEAEIAKCEVRCANCHRRRTWQQLGWWRKPA